MPSSTSILQWNLKSVFEFNPFQNGRYQCLIIVNLKKVILYNLLSCLNIFPVSLKKIKKAFDTFKTIYFGRRSFLLPFWRKQNFLQVNLVLSNQFSGNVQAEIWFDYYRSGSRGLVWIFFFFEEFYIKKIRFGKRRHCRKLLGTQK